jgi:hypothetical protein
VLSVGIGAVNGELYAGFRYQKKQLEYGYNGAVLGRKMKRLYHRYFASSLRYLNYFTRKSST